MKRIKLISVIILFSLICNGQDDFFAALAGKQLDVYLDFGQSLMRGNGIESELNDSNLVYVYDTKTISIYNNIEDTIVNLTPSTSIPYVSSYDFGPDLSFMKDISGDRDVCVFKLAYAGLSLTPTAGIDWDVNETGEMWDSVLYYFPIFITNALQYYDRINIMGCNWTQGTTDASNGVDSASYRIALIALIQAVRDLTDSPQLLFVATRLHYVGIATTQEVDEIRNAVMAEAASDPFMYWSDIDDVPNRVDQVHKTTDGNIMMGNRLYYPYLNRENYNP